MSARNSIDGPVRVSPLLEVDLRLQDILLPSAYKHNSGDRAEPGEMFVQGSLVSAGTHVTGVHHGDLR